MCTSLKYQYCMGRNFDYEVSYNETITEYKKEKYNIKGVTTGNIKEYPLYYDAMNEHGLCIAGLNFECNAYYIKDYDDNIDGVAPWELPIKILGNCKNITEAENYLLDKVIIDKPFSSELPNSQLHWMICDVNDCVILEQTSNDGLMGYYNNGVLTNNPPYNLQLKLYNREFYENENFEPVEYTTKYKSRGMETLGVPGDLTSMGRFQRVSYYKNKLEKAPNNFNPVTQTFNLLDLVKQPYGATPVGNKFEYTIYSIVYDMKNKSLYYKPYDELNVIKF